MAVNLVAASIMGCFIRNLIKRVSNCGRTVDVPTSRAADSRDVLT